MWPCLQGHFLCCPTASYANPPNLPLPAKPPLLGPDFHSLPALFPILLILHHSSQELGWQIPVWWWAGKVSVWFRLCRAGEGLEDQGLGKVGKMLSHGLHTWLPGPAWKSWGPTRLPSWVRPSCPLLCYFLVLFPCGHHGCLFLLSSDELHQFPGFLIPVMESEVI